MHKIQSLIPILVCEDIPAAHDFLVAADLKLSSPRSLPAASSGLVVYVEDVDAHYARARLRGAQTESEPKDMPYGQREYGARDMEGHRWWFATPLK